MHYALPSERCPACFMDECVVPNVVMTPGGPDRVLEVCVNCGFTEDAGAILD